MNRSILLVLAFSLVLLFTTACGPSQEQLDATASQAAADLSGTQTALAPTATATFTPTPVPTDTPTVTPTPTEIPTSTPTPLPAWMFAGLVLEDLPQGFTAMPPEQISALQQGLPQNSVAFGFADEANRQAVMGYLVSYPSQAEQAAFDGMIPQLLDLFATAYGATTQPEIITGLDDLGETHGASTFLAEGGEDDLRWENLLFRRGEVSVFLFVFYAPENKLTGFSGDLARLIDTRLAMALFPATEYWMAMWTFDPPVGFLPKGLYNYHYEWMYTRPSLAGKVSDPLEINISSTTGSKDTPIYDGFVLVQTWAATPQQAWTGSGCEVVSVVNPKQPVRFVWGWVNDTPMNYQQALDHFKSFKVEVYWDGPTAGSATLVMGSLRPFPGREGRSEYLCTLTGTP